MENTFLTETARQLLKRDLSQLVVLVPNHRTGLYLQHRMVEQAKSPHWLPQFYTLSDWLKKMLGWEVADQMDLSLLLYEIFHETQISVDVDEFLPVAQLILRDFDAVDKFLVDPEELFRESVELGSNWIHSEGLDTREGLSLQFEKIWSTLSLLYKKLTVRMHQSKKAYPGYLLRHAIEHNVLRQPSMNQEIAVVGFYWLNNAQLELFDVLREKQAVFYWNQMEHPAGKILDNYIQRYGNALKNPMRREVPDIELVSTPGLHFQSKLVASYLENNKSKPRDTAVVLPTDVLMIPVVSAIPEQYSDVNVAMGLAISSTPVYSLYKAIDLIVKERQFFSGRMLIPLQHLQLFLNNEYVEAHLRLQSVTLDTSSWPRKISKQFMTEIEWGNPHIVGLFFSQDFLFHLEKFLVELYNELSEKGMELDPSIRSELHLQGLYHLCLIGRKVFDQLSNQNLKLAPRTQRVLLHRLVRDASLPFRGEPVRGLQVLGHLEAVNLSFDTLYFLGQNEGIYPSLDMDTLIPSSLRKIYGLPTASTIARVKEFEFYSVINSAKKVYLFYTESGQKSFSEREPNRFIQRLKYGIFDKPPKEKRYHLEMHALKTQVPVILKSKAVMEQIFPYLEESGLSPSAMIDYMQCTLKFYFGRTIRDGEELSEHVDARMLGDLSHEVLQGIYSEYRGQVLLPKDWKVIREKLDMRIRACFEDYYRQPDFLNDTGESLVYRHYLTRLVEKILDHDQTYRSLEMLELEKVHATLLECGDRKIKIRGTVDRLDRSEGKLRLVDYKSKNEVRNKIPRSQLDFESFTESGGVVFQLLVYAWLYLRNHPNERIQPVIYHLMAKQSAEVALPIDLNEERMMDCSLSDLEFIPELIRQIIEEIMDVAIPFEATTDLKTCEWCRFNQICLRKNKNSGNA